MRAAVLRTVGMPLQVENVHLQEPRTGEVRVRVESAGVCHSDLHYMNGDLRGRLPAVLGHEGVGVVEEVGPGVTRLQAGDRVVMTWRPRCGDCEFCTNGRPGLCVLGRVQGSTGGLTDGTSRLSTEDETVHHLMGVSCFAELCVVSARSVVKIPHDIPANVAAVVGCAVVTGVGAALNLMREATAQPTVVIGAGGVGLSAVMGLALIGADPIIVVDTVDARLGLARELGAKITVNAASENVVDVVEQVAPGGARWALDAVGSPTTMEQAVTSIGTAGTLVAVGLGNTEASFRVPVNQLVQQEKRVIGSLYGSGNPVLQIPQILSLYRSGRLPLDRIVGRSYGLDEVNEAYQGLSAGAVGRSTITVSGSPEGAHADLCAPRLSDNSRAPEETSST